MIILPFLILGGFIFLFKAFFIKGDRKLFYAFLLLKIILGIAVGFFYSHYYNFQGDTFQIYNDAKAWFKLFADQELSILQWLGIEPVNLQLISSEPRTRFFTILVSMLMPLSASNYYLVATWMTVISFCSLWLFTQQLIETLKCNKWIVYIPLFLIPSLAFWSSGLLKETLMFGLIASIGLAYLKWRESKNIVRSLLCIALAIIVYWLLFQFKYYVAIVLLPLLLISHFFAHTRIFGSINIRYQISLFFVLILGATAIIASFHPLFQSGLFFDLLKVSHDQIAGNSSLAIINFADQNTSFYFFIINSPKAILTALLRPFLWESWDILSFLLAVESTVFVSLLLLFCYLGIKRKVLPKKKELWWLLSAIIYVLVLGTVICLATPNFGSLARFKVSFMPIAWFVLLYFINKALEVRNL